MDTTLEVDREALAATMHAARWLRKHAPWRTLATMDVPPERRDAAGNVTTAAVYAALRGPGTRVYRYRLALRALEGWCRGALGEERSLLGNLFGAPGPATARWVYVPHARRQGGLVMCAQVLARYEVALVMALEVLRWDTISKRIVAGRALLVSQAVRQLAGMPAPAASPPAAPAGPRTAPAPAPPTA